MDAAWTQQLEAEYCRATGRSFAAVLLDLRKAFEITRHLVLVLRVKDAGFAAALARLALQLYCGPRVIALEGAYSRVVELRCTIVAGCAFATSLLKAYLLPIADKCVKIYPSIKLCVYVDDIGLRQFGWDEGAVARSVAWGTKAVIKDLHEAGSVVNVDKSAFVASTSKMGSSDQPCVG